MRGLSLAGVLVANLLFSFREPMSVAYLGADRARPFADRFAEALVQFAIQGKAITLFSVLFGAGLAIQAERFARFGRAEPWLARRLVVLLAVGLAHLTLFWNGDILTEYALGGLLVLPMLQARVRTLAAVAAALYALSIAIPLTPWVSWPDDAALLREIEDATRIYGDGSWLEIRGYSLHEWRIFSPLPYTVFTATPALMLLGILSWRCGWWHVARRPARALAIVAATGMGAGLLLTAIAASDARYNAVLPAYVAGCLAPVVLAAGYAAFILRVLDAGLLRRACALAAAAGRMAFTNYLVQTLVFTTLFYGYGLGLMGEMGAATALAGGIAGYVLQCVASRMWLARFRFGPMEWAWRSLTYGRRQPFLRRSAQG